MRAVAALSIACFWLLGSAKAEPPRSPPGGTASACIEIAVATGPARCVAPGSGGSTWFRDCPTCPEMVVVPGRIPTSDHAAAPFAVGRFAVTFEEWDACVADLGCNAHVPSDLGWGRGRLPVVNVSWVDAVAYANWLSQKTGKHYRLLGDAEREHVARAGTTTIYWWGDGIGLDQANYDLPIAGRRDGASQSASQSGPRPRGRPVAVDSFEPNPWGLFNVHGNVWEWTADCAPDDGPALAEPVEPNTASGEPACGRRLSRGGSWHDFAGLAGSRSRVAFATDTRNHAQGFRVARDLP